MNANVLEYLTLHHPSDILRVFSPSKLQKAHEVLKSFGSFLDKTTSGKKNMAEIDTCDTLLIVLFQNYLDNILERKGSGNRRGIYLANKYQDFRET